MHGRKYWTLNYPSAVAGSKTLLTGIRGIRDSKKKVYISGFFEPPTDSLNPVITFVYKGTITGNGKWYNFNYPSGPGRTVLVTNFYGPNNGKKCGDIQVVGNYTTKETGMSTIGCLYEGPLDGSGQWRTIIPKSDKPVLNTICHSTMGGFIVGNYDTTLIQGKAFIYDIKNRTSYDIIKESAKSITAYGIWHNGGNYYTICGGYSNLNIESGVDAGYLVDWNRETHRLRNFRSYNFNNDPLKSFVTHFDGITSDGKNGFNLTGDAIGIDETSVAFFAHVKDKNGRSNRAKWSELSYPGSSGTSGNSVHETVAIGVYALSDDGTANGYVSIQCSKL